MDNFTKLGRVGVRVRVGVRPPRGSRGVALSLPSNQTPTQRPNLELNQAL